MFYYKISEGCYEHYMDITLSHEKEYPNIKFAILYNTIIGENESMSIYDISEQLVDKYGFKVVEPKIEINTNYGECMKVDLLAFNNDSDYHQIKWKIK